MAKQNSSLSLFKFGIVLLFIAGLFWVGIVIIPFLPLSAGMKTGMIAFAIIAGEVAFWLGALCTGKEFIQKYKQYFSVKKEDKTDK